MQLDKHALAMEMLATAEGMLGVSDQYERSRINNMRATCLYKVGDYHGAITLLEIAVSIALDQGGLAKDAAMLILVLQDKDAVWTKTQPC